MKKFLFILFLFCFTSFLFAQTEYIHDTGNMTCAIVDNGIIGDDGSGFSGLTFMGGMDVIYTAGHVVGLNGAVMGMCDSYDLTDFTNVVPGTFPLSDANFEQIGRFVLSEVDFNALYYSYSKNGLPAVFFRRTIINNTAQASDPGYVGAIIDFDVGPGNNYNTNSGGYDPARNLVYMYDATAGTAELNYYGVCLLNMPPNSMRAYLIQNYSATNADVFNYLTNDDFSTPPDTADHRLHISYGPVAVPANDRLTVDYAIVCGTDLANLQANVDEAIMTWAPVLPVELTSFTANVIGTKVSLNWSTASELNNFGFEVEKKVGNSNWTSIGFIEGQGTSSETTIYNFVDNINAVNGMLSYRLKQIDLDGNFEYSDVVEIKNIALKYELAQNYPNPFNPATKISYSILEDDFVTLTIFNNIGEMITTLVNEKQESGQYTVQFDASKLSSGLYFYQLNTNNFQATKKMMLIK